MPTPVTVTVQVDATGAIRGSQQAQQALTTALNGINTSAQKVSTQTQTATKFLERFGDAPKRGISALDALNATVLQATGGFQALGPASAAASTGLRAILFAGASLIGTTGTIAIGLAALGVVLAAVSDKANQLKDALKSANDALLETAKTGGALQLTAISLLREKYSNLQAEIDETKKKMAEYAKTLKDAAAGNLPLLASTKEVEANLKTEQLRLIDLNAEMARYKGFLTGAIAADTARSSSAAEHAQAIINARQAQEGWNHILELYGKFAQQAEEIEAARTKNLQVLNQQKAAGLSLDQQLVAVNLHFAKTEDEIRSIYREQISLIQERTAALILAADTEIEKQNARKRGQLEIAQLQAEEIQRIEHYRNNSIRAYREVAQAFETGFLQQLEQAKTATDVLVAALRAAISAALELAAIELAGGGGGGKKDDSGGFWDFVKDVIGVVRKPSAVSGRSSTVTPALALPSARGGTTNISISVHALDTATLTTAVQNRIIPMIENAAAGRRTRIALS